MILHSQDDFAQSNCMDLQTGMRVPTCKIFEEPSRLQIGTVVTALEVIKRHMVSDVFVLLAEGIYFCHKMDCHQCRFLY